MDDDDELSRQPEPVWYSGGGLPSESVDGAIDDDLCSNRTLRVASTLFLIQLTARESSICWTRKSSVGVCVDREGHKQVRC